MGWVQGEMSDYCAYEASFWGDENGLIFFGGVAPWLAIKPRPRHWE